MFGLEASLGEARAVAAAVDAQAPAARVALCPPSTLISRLAHALVEPDQRHGMDYLSERYLGYTPISITTLIGEKKVTA